MIRVICCALLLQAALPNGTAAAANLPRRLPVSWHNSAIWGVAVSGDGSTVVSGSWDGTLRVWEAATGEPLATRRVPLRGRAPAMRLAPDGAVAAVRIGPRAVRLVPLKKGGVETDLTPFASEVGPLAFSPNGRLLAVALKDSTVQLVRLNQAGPAGAQLRLPESARALAFGPDGRTLYVSYGSDCGTYAAWDLTSGQRTRVFEKGIERRCRYPGAVAVNERVAVFGGHGAVHVFDARSGARVRSLEFAADSGDPQLGFVESLQLDHAGKLLYALTPGGQRAWTLASGAPVRLPALADEVNTAAGRTVALFPNGKKIATGTFHGEVGVRQLRRDRTLWSIRGPAAGVAAAAFRPGAHELLLGLGDGSVELWDTTRMERLARKQVAKRDIADVVWTPDGETAWLAAEDGQILRWSRRRRAVTGKRLKLGGAAHALVLSQDGAKLYAAGGGGEIVRFDTKSGAREQTFRGQRAAVKALALRPDGAQLAASGEDGTIQMWDTTTGASLRTLIAAEGRLPQTALAYSPDGRTLASAHAYMSDEVVRLWAPESGELRRTLKGRSWLVRLRFSADGAHLHGSDLEAGVSTWRVADGAEIRHLAGFSGYGFALAVSDDETLIALGCGGQERSLRVWQVK